MVCDPPTSRPSLLHLTLNHHCPGESGLGTATETRKLLGSGVGWGVLMDSTAKGIGPFRRRTFTPEKSTVGDDSPQCGQDRPQAEEKAEALVRQMQVPYLAPARGSSLCPPLPSVFATVSFCVHHGS
jgi:hypothetical protein